MDPVLLEQQQERLAEEVVRAIGEQVLGELTFDQTVWVMCRRLVDSLPYPLIWIGTKEFDGAIKVRAFGGESGHLVQNSQEFWKRKPEAQGAAARAIQSNAIQEFHADDLAQFGPERLLRKQGIRSCLAIPLMVQNQVLGVINIYAQFGQTFEPHVIPCLQRLAGQLSLGLFRAREYDYLRIQEAGLSSAERAVCIANPDGYIEWVNEAYGRLTGYGRGEVIGSLLPSFSSKDWRRRLKKRNSPLASGTYCRTELVNTHKDGSVYTVEEILTPLLDEQGLIKNFVSVLQDITARKKIEAQMMHRAHYDPLTNLPNRVLFQDRLNQALAWARRQGSLVCVMFLDLDRFKQINDDFGHGTGDKVLQTLAARVNHCVRGTDTIARLSGDEFTIILQDLQQIQDVYRVAQKILRCLEHPIPLEGQTLSPKASMGIAMYPLDGTDPEVLLQRADGAMYQAKALGGQGYRFASEELNIQLAALSGSLSHTTLL